MTVIMRVCAESDTMRRLWWSGPCPWPGLPVAWGSDGHEQMTWQCCEAGYDASIIKVMLHLPVEHPDPMFTMTIATKNSGLDHLERYHGFTATQAPGVELPVDSHTC